MSADAMDAVAKRHAPAFVHSAADVEDGTSIGAGTKIWRFCHVMKGAVIGSDCVLGQGCFVASTVVLGDRVRVQNGVSIYDGVVAEHDVFVGPSAVFTNIRRPRASFSQQGAFEPTRLRSGCTIGANATVRCGVTIGRHAFVGAGAVVTRDVADFALVVGNPARQVGWVSKVGAPLPEPDAQGRTICPETGESYRLAGGVMASASDDTA